MVQGIGIADQYWNGGMNTSPLIKWWSEDRNAMVPGIWIVNHLMSEQIYMIWNLNTKLVGHSGIDFINFICALRPCKNHRESSIHLHPTPTPNFLRSFLLAQSWARRFALCAQLYEIDPRSLLYTAFDYQAGLVRLLFRSLLYLSFTWVIEIPANGLNVLLVAWLYTDWYWLALWQHL